MTEEINVEINAENNLSEEIKQIVDDLEDLKGNVGDSDEEIEEFDEKIGKLRQSFSRARSDLSDYDDEVLDSVDSISELNDEIDNIVERNFVSKGTHDDLRKSISNLSDEYDANSRKAKELLLAQAAINSELEGSELNVEELNDELQQYLAIASTNVAASEALAQQVDRVGDKAEDTGDQIDDAADESTSGLASLRESLESIDETFDDIKRTTNKQDLSLEDFERAKEAAQNATEAVEETIGAIDRASDTELTGLDDELNAIEETIKDLRFHEVKSRFTPDADLEDGNSKYLYRNLSDEQGSLSSARNTLRTALITGSDPRDSSSSSGSVGSSDSTISSISKISEANPLIRPITGSLSEADDSEDISDKVKSPFDDKSASIISAALGADEVDFSNPDSTGGGTASTKKIVSQTQAALSSSRSISGGDQASLNQRLGGILGQLSQAYSELSGFEEMDERSRRDALQNIGDLDQLINVVDRMPAIPTENNKTFDKLTTTIDDLNELLGTVDGEADGSNIGDALAKETVSSTYSDSDIVKHRLQRAAGVQSQIPDLLSSDGLDFLSKGSGHTRVTESVTQAQSSVDRLSSMQEVMPSLHRATASKATVDGFGPGKFGELMDLFETMDDFDGEEMRNVFASLDNRLSDIDEIFAEDIFDSLNEIDEIRSDGLAGEFAEALSGTSGTIQESVVDSDSAAIEDVGGFLESIRRGPQTFSNDLRQSIPGVSSKGLSTQETEIVGEAVNRAQSETDGVTTVGDVGQRIPNIADARGMDSGEIENLQTRFESLAETMYDLRSAQDDGFDISLENFIDDVSEGDTTLSKMGKSLDQNMGKTARNILTEFASDSEKANSAFNDLEDAFKRITPQGTTLTANIGFINVAIRNLTGTVPRLVANLGPLVSALGATATAAIAAAGALAGFAGAGALGLAEGLANHFASIKNRAEGLETILRSLKEAFIISIEPLRNANLGGDGVNAIQFFIDTIQGLMQAVNGISIGLANIVETDQFRAFVEDISAALFSGEDSGLSKIMASITEATKELLPAITDLIVVVIEEFPQFLSFLVEMTRIIGPGFAELVRHLGDIIALLTVLGGRIMAGALDGLNEILTVAEDVANVLTEVTDAFNIASDASSVLGHNILYTIGRFYVLIKAGSLLGSSIMALIAAISSLQAGLSALYVVFTILPTPIAVAIGALSALVIGLVFFGDLLSPLTTTIATFANAIGIELPSAMESATIATMALAGTKSILTFTTFSSISATIYDISSTLALAAAKGNLMGATKTLIVSKVRNIFTTQTESASTLSNFFVHLQMIGGRIKDVIVTKLQSVAQSIHTSSVVAGIGAVVSYIGSIIVKTVLGMKDAIISGLQATAQYILSGGFLATAGAALTASGALSVFQAALVGTGIGAIIVAIGLLIGAFLNMGGTVDMITGIFDTVIDYFTDMPVAIKAMVAQLMLPFAPLILLLLGIKELFKYVLNPEQTAAGWSRAVEQATQAIKEEIDDIANGIAEFFDPLLDIIMHVHEMIENAVDYLPGVGGERSNDGSDSPPGVEDTTQRGAGSSSPRNTPNARGPHAKGIGGGSSSGGRDTVQGPYANGVPASDASYSPGQRTVIEDNRTIVVESEGESSDPANIEKVQRLMRAFESGRGQPDDGRTRY